MPDDAAGAPLALCPVDPTHPGHPGPCPDGAGRVAPLTAEERDAMQVQATAAVAALERLEHWEDAPSYCGAAPGDVLRLLVALAAVEQERDEARVLWGEQQTEISRLAAKLYAAETRAIRLAALEAAARAWYESDQDDIDADDRLAQVIAALAPAGGAPAS